MSIDSTAPRYTILLGGIGGDAHSVGLTILRQALMRRYRVLYLGPQSDVEEFFQLASIANIAMISCMDGHAMTYLRRFPELARRYPTSQLQWYLGGNPALGVGVSVERPFIELGFRRVFCRFIDVRAVFDCLARDLANQTAARDPLGLWATHVKLRGVGEAPEDRTLEEVELLELRASVLESWRTGAGARELDDNAAFLSRRPSFVTVQARQRELGRPLLQPRSGVALVDEQIELFRAFKRGGADTLSYQVDSLTRNNNYVAAEEGIRASVASGHSRINGFPVVNHGVTALRRIATAIEMPLQTRHSTRAPELLAEISYAGGVTAYEGGPICYNLPYYKDYAPSASLRAWQYVDRLTGLYAERYGIILDREFFGTLTATLIPPSIAIATGVIESCLAARQGVRCVSVGYAEQGNRTQDIAAIRTIRSFVPKLLERLGFGSVQVNAIFHQYMAAFPTEQEKACQLISESATTATLAEATRVLTKSAVEATRIPSLADNFEALALVRQGIEAAGSLYVDPVAVAREEEIIRREVECIVEGVLLCGGGNLNAGVVKAFESGVLDIPFAPSVYTRGEVVTARDRSGAVRFLDPGKLPLDRDLVAMHRDLMSDRCHADGWRMGDDNHLIVEHDVLQTARGQYEQWPLGE